MRAYLIGVTRAYEPKNGIQTVVGGKTLKMHSVAAVGSRAEGRVGVAGMVAARRGQEGAGWGGAGVGA